LSDDDSDDDRAVGGDFAARLASTAETTVDLHGTVVPMRISAGGSKVEANPLMGTFDVRSEGQPTYVPSYNSFDSATPIETRAAGFFSGRSQS
jgi:hypothetical protein